MVAKEMETGNGAMVMIREEKENKKGKKKEEEEKGAVMGKERGRVGEGGGREEVGKG